jgi:hypothetical protein
LSHEGRVLKREVLMQYHLHSLISV